MKKLILVLLIAFVVEAKAQDDVRKPITSPQIEQIFTPKSSQNKARIEIDFNNDTVWVFYYSCKVDSFGRPSSKTRHLDCMFPFVKSDFAIIFNKYKLWIEENKEIE